MSRRANCIHFPPGALGETRIVRHFADRGYFEVGTTAEKLKTLLQETRA